MKIIDLPGGQGSEAWHEHRRAHWNASDAPAMMGCSPYKTRNQLLRELKTGVAQAVDDATQRRFDDGHRTEALARPIAERLLDEDLYPITVANGRLSASLDGATLDGRVNFEHKMLNEELRTVMVDGCTGANLPLLYRVQMEHQLHCSGAERTLFMASKWSDSGQLVEERHCWYYPDPALRKQVLAGWEQFERDLAEYVPAEVTAPVTATVQQHLPAVSVQVNGTLAVVSNLAPFGVALRAFIEKIPKKPNTDQEFADTDAACKRLKEAEERLQQAEDAALSSMGDVEQMRRMVAEFRELARTTRLASEKLVAARKVQIREEEVMRGTRELGRHLKALNDRLGAGNFMPDVPLNFAAVIKGLKTLDSVRNAIDTELARAKIEASALADKIDANLKAMSTGSEGFCGLFPDMKALALKEPDDLSAVIAQRVAQRKASLESERQRIAAEEAARIERERAAKYTPPGTQSAPAAPITTNASEVALPAAAGPYAGNAPQAAQGAPSGDEGTGAHAEECAPEPAFGGVWREVGPTAFGFGTVIERVDTPAPATAPPTLNLGTIQKRLGFTVGDDFLASLGFTGQRERSAMLYQEHSFAAMCSAIASHVLSVGESHAQK